jgi:hypothetical protein
VSPRFDYQAAMAWLPQSYDRASAGQGFQKFLSRATQIPFGWVSGSLLAAVFLLVARWFLLGGIHGNRCLVALPWLALKGCHIQARFDFPSQVHSFSSAVAAPVRHPDNAFAARRMKRPRRCA